MMLEISSAYCYPELLSFFERQLVIFNVNKKFARTQKEQKQQQQMLSFFGFKTQKKLKQTQILSFDPWIVLEANSFLEEEKTLEESTQRNIHFYEEREQKPLEN